MASTQGLIILLKAGKAIGMPALPWGCYRGTAGLGTGLFMLSQKTLGHRRHEQALPHLLGTQIGMLMLHMVALGQDRSRDRPGYAAKW